jgi:DNA-binding NtrC family response regulator
MPRLLVSWIGNHDLIAAKSPTPEEPNLGPVLRVVLDRKPDQVHLLNDILTFDGDPDAANKYRSWLEKHSGVPTTMYSTPKNLNNDLDSAYRHTCDRLNELRGTGKDFLLNVSPGAFAMQVGIVLANLVVLHGEAELYSAFHGKPGKDAGVDRVWLPAHLEADILPHAMQRFHATRPEPEKLAALGNTIRGTSAAIQFAKAEALRVAPFATKPCCLNVILRGESGTGKELFAQAIHDNSPRKGPLYRVVNCGAIAPGVAESELFGHVKRAFTNAIENRRGAFAAVSGGTLFLDEIGDLSLDLQVKLLRAIENGEITPVGSNEVTKVDVRIVVATHRDLQAMIEAGEFRHDLYERLNGETIILPPLRHRREDIQVLAEHFLAGVNKAYPGLGKKLSSGALDELRRGRYRGNVRTLRELTTRIVAHSSGPEITPDEVRLQLQKLEPRATFPDLPLGEVGNDEFLCVLSACLDELAFRLVGPSPLRLPAAAMEKPERDPVEAIVWPLLQDRLVKAFGNAHAVRERLDFNFDPSKNKWEGFLCRFATHWGRFISGERISELTGRSVGSRVPTPNDESAPD